MFKTLADEMLHFDAFSDDFQVRFCKEKIPNGLGTNCGKHAAYLSPFHYFSRLLTRCTTYCYRLSICFRLVVDLFYNQGRVYVFSVCPSTMCNISELCVIVVV